MASNNITFFKNYEKSSKISELMIGDFLLSRSLHPLFLDLGGFTAWRYEYYFPFVGLIVEKGTIKVNDPKLMVDKVIEVIKKYKINYLVVEREAIDKYFIRPEPNYSKIYLESLKILIDYCHQNNIKGCAILPRTEQETKKWAKDNDYCLRKSKSKNEYWCDFHLTTHYETFRRNNVDILEPIKIPIWDEVDARCNSEVFWFEIFPNPQLLKERERIFDLPMRIEPIKQNGTNYLYQQTKTKRLNYFRTGQVNNDINNHGN